MRETRTPKSEIDFSEYSDQAIETISRILSLAETIRQRASLIRPNQSTATSRGAVIDTGLSQRQIEDLQNLRIGTKLAIDIVKAKNGLMLRSTEREGLFKDIEHIDRLDLKPSGYTATRIVKKFNPITRKETGRNTVESLETSPTESITEITEINELKDQKLKPETFILDSVENLLTNFENKLQSVLDKVNLHIDS